MAKALLLPEDGDGWIKEVDQARLERQNALATLRQMK